MLQRSNPSGSGTENTTGEQNKTHPRHTSTRLFHRTGFHKFVVFHGLQVLNDGLSTGTNSNMSDA